MAYLLTSNLIRESESCGIAFSDVAGTDQSIGLGAHACNMGAGYTFGHEIGHMFGCGHNEEDQDIAMYPYGHGAYISPPG